MKSKIFKIIFILSLCLFLPACSTNKNGNKVSEESVSIENKEENSEEADNSENKSSTFLSNHISLEDFTKKVKDGNKHFLYYTDGNPLKLEDLVFETEKFYIIDDVTFSLEESLMEAIKIWPDVKIPSTKLGFNDYLEGVEMSLESKLPIGETLSAIQKRIPIVKNLPLTPNIENLDFENEDKEGRILSIYFYPITYHISDGKDDYYLLKSTATKIRNINQTISEKIKESNLRIEELNELSAYGIVDFVIKY